MRRAAALEVPTTRRVWPTFQSGDEPLTQLTFVSAEMSEPRGHVVEVGRVVEASYPASVTQVREGERGQEKNTAKQ